MSAATGTATVDVLMPQMGTSVVEGTIVEWRAEVGGAVVADETICEISTDKVDSECPSPATGTLAEIVVPAGETVDVGTVIGRITVEGGAGATDGEAHAPEGGAEAPATVPADGGAQTAAGAGDGNGAVAATSASPGSSGAARSPDAPSASGTTPDATNGTEPSRREVLRCSSPVAARIASEHGIDVTRMTGTGRSGRVTKADVLRAVEERATGSADDAPMHIESPYRPDPTLQVAGATAPQATAASADAPAPAATAPRPATPAPVTPPASPASATPPVVPDDLGGVPVPMTRMRTAIGAAMRRALDTAAHATTIVECDMSRIERRRRELGVTALPLLARHTIDTLKDFPALNATFDGETVTRYERVHLGIAVSLGEDGLIVPVIHDAQDLSPEGLSRRVKDLAVRARGKALSPDEVQGGTFTITNPGASGAVMATPVINVPQVAILDLEAIVRRPVVVTDEDGQESIAIRPMVNLCMSWDHRVLDGVYAAQFLTALRKRVEGRDAG